MNRIDMTMRKSSLALIALVLAAPLAGCNTASSSDETASRFLVAPDKYVLYGCPQLAQAREESLKRLRELEALIQKASVDAAGRMMSAAAYRSEYLSIKGDLREQERTAREKNCHSQPGRPASRQSDVIIR